MSYPSVATIKRLFAVSGNVCAFPGCRNPLVDSASGKVTGRICHIKASKPGAARYDASQSDNARNAFENLLLMCPIHHDVIDSDLESYTVERLQAIKTAVESVEGSVNNVAGAVEEQTATTGEINANLQAAVSAVGEVTESLDAIAVAVNEANGFAREGTEAYQKLRETA